MEIEKELNHLIREAQDERADALGEITGQATTFLGNFLNLLTATGGYPATAKVLTAASFLAGFCAMYYKGKYARPRPTALCPALMPPIPVPGHASFPSGHSTQAHLMALCMEDVLTDLPTAQQDVLNHDLKALAHRIARNREIGGFHYRSDTHAGHKLAEYIQERLPAASTSWYQNAVKAARLEWQP